MENKELINDFDYPKEFIRAVGQNLINLDPWLLLFGVELKNKFSGIKLRYPNRALIPFAARRDNDDVACFDVNSPSLVHIIHDFAQEGWEQRERFDSFWDWFKKAIDDMIEYEP